MIFNKNLMKYLVIIFCVFAFMNIFQQGSIAQDSTINTIYIKDGCDWCSQLETAITQNKLKDKLTIIEKNISDEVVKSEFDSITTTCAVENPGTPLLVVNGKCFLGFELSKNELFKQAGIAIIENTGTNTDNTSEKPTSNLTISPSPSPEPSSNIITNKVIAPQQSYKWFEIVLLIVAPLTFLTLGYLAITRLKL
jgi:glutaredoxin